MFFCRLNLEKYHSCVSPSSVSGKFLGFFPSAQLRIILRGDFLILSYAKLRENVFSYVSFRLGNLRLYFSR